jgi:hypothetical protein
VSGGGTVGSLQLTQQRQGCEVGGDLRRRAARCEVVLSCGPKRRPR